MKDHRPDSRFQILDSRLQMSRGGKEETVIIIVGSWDDDGNYTLTSSTPRTGLCLSLRSDMWRQAQDKRAADSML